MSEPLPRHAAFAACLPGLEPWLRRELEEIGLRPGAVAAGGVELEADGRAVLRANLQLGLASHVYLRLGEFHARSLGELVRKTARLPWGRWLRPDRELVVRASCKRSRLYHSGAVEQRVAEGVAQALGDVPAAPPAAGGEPVAAVLVRLRQDHCTLSLDTSGEPLHRRGWRTEAGEAPLREDLARALVMASGWDRDRPLCDPMAGSGTILIEALGLASRTPPGHLRRFAFESCAFFAAETWRDVRDRALSGRAPPVLAYGCDRDAEVLRYARANADRAGFGPEYLELDHASLREARPFGREMAVGGIVTNPPFGHRIGDPRSLHKLYQAFGHRVRGLGAGVAVALLAHDRRLALRTGLPLRTAFLSQHGGLQVRAMVTAG